MSRKTTRILIAVLEIVALSMIGFAACQFNAVYKRPLAAALALDVDESPTAVASNSTAKTTLFSPTPTVPPGICSQTGVKTILFLARDKSYGVWPYGADLIRFVRVDFNNRTIRLIAVQRDMWVQTPHLVPSLNLENSRLGLVYFRVEQNALGTPNEIATASTGAVAQAIYDNFSVIADHYIFFEMRYFADAIDQLGGLDVNIPASLTYGDVNFAAGEQHLDGTRALLYARVLPENELSNGWRRMDRQNLILRALIARVLEPANLLKIPGLIQQFRDDLTTDLSPELITSLACMVNYVPSDQITTLQVEKDLILGPGPDDSMLPDVEKVTTFLKEQLAP